MAGDLTGYRNSVLAQLGNEEALQRQLKETPKVDILNNGTTNQQQSVNILHPEIQDTQYNTQDMKTQALNTEVETGLGTRLEDVMSDSEKQKYLNSLSEEQYNQMLQYKNEGYGFMASKALLENSHKLANPTATGLLKYNDYDKKDAYYNNTWDLNPDGTLGKFATWLQGTFGNQTPTEYLANWWNTKYGEKVEKGEETFLDRFGNLTFGTLINLVDSGASGAMGIIDKGSSKLNAKLDRDILGLDTDNKFYREMDTNLASDIAKYVGSAITLAALGKLTVTHPLSMLTFNITGSTGLGDKAIDLTIGNIARLANWTLDSIPGIRAGYRQLDDKGKEALVNVATLGILHGLGKYGAPKLANTKVGNYVGEVKTAVRKSLERGVKQGVQDARIQADVERQAGTKQYDYIDPETGESGRFDSFEGYDRWYKERIAQAGIRGFREGFWDGIYDEFKNVGSNKGKFGDTIVGNNLGDGTNRQNGEPEYNPEGGPQGDGNSGGGSNNVNGNNNKGFARNVKSTIGESKLATWNRMTKGEINKFFDRYGQSYTQWLIDRGFINSYENNIQPLINYAQKVQADKESVLKTIPTRYVDARVNDMLREVLKRAEYIKDPDLPKIQNLVLKNSQGGLTLLDTDWIRKRYGDNIRTGFYSDNNSKEIQRADNIYYRVQEFLEQKAAENGFEQLKELNKEISAAYHIIINTTKRANGIQANQQITLKEAIILAGAMSNPKTRPIALFKMMIRSASIKDKVLKILLKGKTPKEKKELKIDFEKIIKAVEANKEAEAQKQFEEFMAKREVDTQPLENALGYDPEVGEFVDYSTPTMVTPEGQSKRYGQILETSKGEIKQPGTTKPAEKIVESVVKELVREGVLEKEVAETVKENLLDNLSQQAQEKLAEVEQKIEVGEELMEEEKEIVEKVADTIEDNKEDLQAKKIREFNENFEKQVDNKKLDEIREFVNEGGELKIVPIGIRKTVQLKNHGVMLSKAELDILKNEGLLGKQPKEQQKTENVKDNVVTAESVDDLGLEKQELKGDPNLSDVTEWYGRIGDYNVIIRNNIGEDTYTLVVTKGGKLVPHVRNMHITKESKDAYHFYDLDFETLKKNLNKAINGKHFKGMDRYKGKTILHDKDGNNYVYNEDMKKEYIDDWEGEDKEPVEVETKEVIGKTDTMNQLQDKIRNIKTFDDFGEIFTKVEDPLNLSAMYGPGKEQYKDAYYYGKLGGKDIVIKRFAPHDRGTLNIGQGAEMSYGRPILSELERATDNPITLEQIKAKLLNADDETLKTIGQTQESDYNTDNLQPNTTTNEQVGGLSTEASEGIQGDNGQLSNSEEILGMSMNDTGTSSEESNGRLRTTTDNVEELGTRPTTGGVATRGQQRLNNQNAKQILEEHNFSTNQSDYTADELSVLRNYQGAGGLTNKGEDTLGVLDQFYTPQVIVDKMWGLANKFKTGDIELALEPTVGTGRFLRDGIKFDAYEIDKFPGTIAQILNPNANVKIGDFQDLFMDFTGKRTKEYNGPKYDLVIGNPPYSHRDTPQRALGDDKKIDRFEQYFIKKGIDVLKDDGTLVMIVPSTFLRNGENYAKQEILKKATLVEAYRLPAGVFDNTDVGTDIIVFKKNREGSTAISNNERFIQHPEKVLGVEKERMNRFGGMEKYVEGDISELDRISTATEKVLTPADKKAENYEKKESEVHEKPIETAVAKPKKKPVRKTKKDDTTIQQGTKDNLESKIVAIGDINDYDSRVLDYLPKVNVDGYVEGVNPESDIDNLNYLHGKTQLNVLYFAGDIYEKLRILEDEKGQMSADLYNKQKQGLERAIPKEYTINDIVFDPNDKELLEMETTILKDKQGWKEDADGVRYWGTITKKQTIGDLFRDYVWDKVPRSSGLDKREFDKYMNGQPMDRERKSDTKRITKEYLNKFMQEELDEETQNKITEQYNKKLRAYVRPNFEGVPLVLNNISKTFRTLKDIAEGNEGKPLVLSDGQIRGINFLLMKGTGLVAHGVGHGKTMEGVIATVEAMNRGWNKRPLFIVPGPTVNDNWIHTIKELYPDKEIVDLGGLTKPDKTRLTKALGPDPRDWIKDGQIAILTHDGLSNAIDFKTGTKDRIKAELTDTMGEESDNTKKQEEKKNKVDTMVEATTKASGKGYTYTVPDSFLKEKYKAMEEETYDDFIKNFVKDAMEEFKITDKESLETQAKQLWSERPIFIEDLGIDHITVDEAHNFKNLFSSAKMAETGEVDKNGKAKKELNRFSNVQGPRPSIQAKKLYFATQYVLDRNNNRNVFLLTATPFNNHAIEVYNMLSFMAKKRLTDLGIKNINSFFSKFANFLPDNVVTVTNDVKEKDIMKSFANAEELQRIVTEFMDYLGDRPDLIKPKKKLVAPILVNSELGKNLQEYLEELAMKDPKEVPGAMIKSTVMMMNALISPYLVPAYFEEMGEFDAPTTTELIENSPKLKFSVDVIKKMQEKGRKDGVFIYMPRFNGLGGVNYHELFRKAISEYTGIPEEQIGIISGEGTYKKNKDITAKKFRDGDIRILIGGENTREGIDLQTSGYITINLLQGWNPTDRIQLNGRIWRQGNFRNEVLEVVPMIINSGDAFMQQKFDEKSSRGNNIFEFAGGKVFDVEEMNHEEMKFNLLTDIEKKVKTYIDMETAKIKKRSEMIGGDIATLQGLKEKKKQADQIPFYQEKLEQARATNNEAQVTVYTDSLKKAMYAKKYLDEKLQQLQITADEIDKEILNKEKEIELINESVAKLKAQEPEIRRQFEEESIRQLEGMKKTDDWLDIIGNYIDNLQLFKDKQELKNWLDENADEDLQMVEETFKPKKIEIKIDEVKVENVPIEGNTPALKVDEKENFDLDTGKDYSLLDLQIFAQTTDMNVIQEIDNYIKEINNILEVNEGKEEDQKEGIHLKRDNGNYYMSVPKYSRYGSKEIYQSDNYRYWNSITYDGIKRQLKNKLDDEKRELERRKKE